MMVDDLVEHITRMQNFAGLDINVRRLASDPATLNERLVYMNTSMCQRPAPSRITGHQQYRPKARCIANACRPDWALHLAHPIIDRPSPIHYTAGHSDVQ